MSVSNDSSFELISADSPDDWRRALENFAGTDVYHLPEYNKLMSQIDHGDPYLFSFKYRQYSAALPFLVRSLSDLPWDPGKLNDVISAYGYPGLIANGPANDSRFLSELKSALFNAFRQLGVVTGFIRHHPILTSPDIAAACGNYEHSGQTVAIKLSVDDDEQLRQMRKSHRYELRKSLKAGVQVYKNYDFSNLDTFIELYEATMKRVGARDYYYFSRDYYQELVARLKSNVVLLHAKLDDEIIASAFFFTSKPIIQYHLSATRIGFETLSPARVLVDHMRQWGSTAGFEWLHLGGGLGASEDALFRFKSGFSKERFPFTVSRYVVDEDRYAVLLQQREDWLSHHGRDYTSSGFFPGYRDLPAELKAS